MANPTIPPFYNMVYTNKEGILSTEAYLYNDQLFQVLNNLITVSGVKLASFTTTEVTAFPANVPVGTIWYNSTLKKLQFQSDIGTIETITST